MKKLILTGFERFGTYLRNPTESLVKGLHGKVIAGYEINSIVYPSEISMDFGCLSVNTAKFHGAETILSLGLSSKATGIEAELIGENWANNPKYLIAEQNGRPISDSHPEKERLRLPQGFYDVKKFTTVLCRSGLRLYFAHDVGYWCCNALVYSTLCALRSEQARLNFAYFHFPCTAASLRADERKDKYIITEEQLLFTVEKFLESIY